MSRSLILTAVAGFAITLAGCAENASPFTGKMVNASELALELQAETRKVEADTRQQAAKAKADAAALESAAKRKSREFALSVRTVKADADAKVEQLGIEADQSAEAIARELASIADRIDLAKQSAADKANELAAKAKAAQDKIDDQRALLDTVLGVLPSVPGVGGNPLAMLALAAATGYLGRKTGKTAGVAQGRDMGWDERDAHQKVIDATWEEASARKGVV